MNKHHYKIVRTVLLFKEAKIRWGAIFTFKNSQNIFFKYFRLKNYQTHANNNETFYFLKDLSYGIQYNNDIKFWNSFINMKKNIPVSSLL